MSKSTIQLCCRRYMQIMKNCLGCYHRKNKDMKSNYKLSTKNYQIMIIMLNLGI